MKLSIKTKRFLTEATYQLVRIPVKQSVLKAYKPIILNANVVPNDGPIIFTPNHRQTGDAFLMLAAIEESVHWMALKRFFTGEDSICNNSKNPILRGLTAGIFRGIGAVPVIRDQDRDRYPGMDNAESMKEFDSYLKAGASIGIFPEGTTNKQPDQQNLTKPKTSAFYFAKENKTWVQPISIVWVPKELNISNRAIINFREPFNAGEMKLTDISDRWIETVNEGIEENNKIIESLVNIGEITSKDAKVKKLELKLRK